MRKAALFFVLAFEFSLTLRAQTEKSPATAGNLQQKLAEAQTLLEQGKPSEASAIYVQLMQQYPHDRNVVQHWVIANMKRIPTGEQVMLDTLKIMAARYPKNTGILYWKTFLEMEHDMNKEALFDMELLTQMEPDSASNFFIKGQILYTLERYCEARDAFAMANKIDPKNAESWGLEALALGKMKSFEKAFSAMDKALALTPENANLLYNRACLCCMAGNKNDALAFLKKAFAINPRLKQYAPTDTDLKMLYDDETFKKLIQP